MRSARHGWSAKQVARLEDLVDRGGVVMPCGRLSAHKLDRTLAEVGQAAARPDVGERALQVREVDEDQRQDRRCVGWQQRHDAPLRNANGGVYFFARRPAMLAAQLAPMAGVAAAIQAAVPSTGAATPSNAVCAAADTDASGR